MCRIRRETNKEKVRKKGGRNKVFFFPRVVILLVFVHSFVRSCDHRRETLFFLHRYIYIYIQYIQGTVRVSIRSLDLTTTEQLIDQIETYIGLNSLLSMALVVVVVGFYR